MYGAVEMSRGLPPELHARYFQPRGGQWQVSDEIRGMTSFRKANLLSDFTGLGRFDIIFCRNVAIYFGDADRRLLFERMERALEPEGSLIVGAMESLNSVCPRLEPKRHLRAIYYQTRSTP